MSMARQIEKARYTRFVSLVLSRRHNGSNSKAMRELLEVENYRR